MTTKQKEKIVKILQAYKCNDPQSNKEIDDLIFAVKAVSPYEKNNHKVMSPIGTEKEFLFIDNKGKKTEITRKKAKELCYGHPGFLGYIADLDGGYRKRFQVMEGTIQRLK